MPSIAKTAKIVLCLALAINTNAFNVQHAQSARWAPRTAAGRKASSAVTMQSSSADKFGAATAAGLILAVRRRFLFCMNPFRFFLSPASPLRACGPPRAPPCHALLLHRIVF